DGSRVADQNFDGQALRLRPDLRTQNLDGVPANSLAAPITNDEKLPNVNLLGLLAKECIGHSFTPLLANDRAIFACQPASHPLLQFRHRHWIPMPLILNQFMIQLRQERAIIECCETKFHRSGFCCRTMKYEAPSSATEE